MKLLFTLICLFLLDSSLRAQERLWSHRYTVFRSDISCQVACATNDGGICVVVVPSSSRERSSILKVDSKGKLLWRGDLADRVVLWVWSVVRDGSGYEVIYRSWEENQSAYGFWVTSFDSYGKVISERQLSIDPDYEVIDAVPIDNGFGVLTSPILHPPVPPPPDSDVVFATAVILHQSSFGVLKLDFRGNQKWSRHFDNRPDTLRYAAHLRQIRDGGFIVWGSKDDMYAETSGNTASSFDEYWRINAEGELLWTREFVRSDVFVVDVNQTSDGGFLLAGNRGWGSESATLMSFLDEQGQRQGVPVVRASGGQDVVELVEGTNGSYILLAPSSVRQSPRDSVTLIALSSTGIPVSSHRLGSPDWRSLGDAHITMTKDSNYFVSAADYQSNGSDESVVPDLVIAKFRSGK